MKALVTGAAGFIGSHLSAALLDGGASVTGIDCFTDYYARTLKEANLATVRERPGFTFIEGALQETDLKPLLAGVTHVFHLAAEAFTRPSSVYSVKCRAIRVGSTQSNMSMPSATAWRMSCGWPTPIK